MNQIIFSLVMSMLITSISTIVTSLFSDINSSMLTADLGLGFSIKGVGTISGYGNTVYRAGDVNNDGIDDIIIGAPGALGHKGAVYVIFGTSSGFTDIDLSTTNLSSSQRGFMIAGAAVGDYLGYSVSCAGDINHDGIDDIIFGAYGSFGFAGAVYGLFGKASGHTDIDLGVTSLSISQQGFTIAGPLNGYLGNSVSKAGDVNQDGIDDIIIGAFRANTESGVAYVVFGKIGGPGNIDLKAISLSTSSKGFQVSGTSNDNLGMSVSSAGDVNKDGIDDVIIGAWHASAAYVIFGAKTGLADINLSMANFPSQRGFKITGHSSSDYFGSLVSSAGDINKDGIDDIMIGAGSAYSTMGVTYVIFGRSGGFPNINFATTNLSTTQQGFQINGTTAGDSLGTALSSAGDLNGDGISDIVIGAHTSLSSIGSVYVVFGRSNGFTDINLATVNLSTHQQGFRILGISDYSHFGYTVHSVGDVNNDGVDDIIIGTLAASGASSLGADYIIFGKSNAPTKEITSSNLYYLATITTATSIIESIINTISSSLCIGSSIPVRTGFISKLIQNIRYLNITYSSQVETILQPSKSRLLNFRLPVKIDRQITSGAISVIYTRFGLKPSFLSNFWKNTIITISAFASWLACVALVCCFKQQHSISGSIRNTAYIIFKTLSQAILNFLIVQIYGDFGDVVLFTILEIRSVSFITAYSYASFACSLFFMILGLSLLGWHFIFLIKYQELKPKSPTDSHERINQLTKKLEGLAVLFRDFSCKSVLRHGFLLLMTVRSTLVSLMVGTALSFPLLESTLLVCCSIIMCIYLLCQNPFKARFEIASQLFMELCVLVIYVCVWLLAILDSQNAMSFNDRERAELTIIVTNIILKYGCILITIFKMINLALVKCKGSSKKDSKVVRVLNNGFSSLNESSNSRVHMRPNVEESFINAPLPRQNVTGSKYSTPAKTQKTEKQQVAIVQCSDTSYDVTAAHVNKSAALKIENLPQKAIEKNIFDKSQSSGINLILEKDASHVRKLRSIARQNIIVPKINTSNIKNEEYHDKLERTRIHQRQSPSSRLTKAEKIIKRSNPKQIKARGVSTKEKHLVKDAQEHIVDSQPKSFNFSCNFELPAKLVQTKEVGLPERSLPYLELIKEKEKKALDTRECQQRLEEANNKRKNISNFVLSIEQQETGVPKKSYLQIIHENREQHYKDLYGEYNKEPIRSKKEKETQDMNKYGQLDLARMKKAIESVKANRIDSYQTNK